MENKIYNGLINSGKTEKIISEVKNKINNNESMIILDSKNEYKELFKNYEIIEFDLNALDEFTGYNPFYRASKLYKEDKIDEAIEVIINIGNKIFKTIDSLDPFWDNSAKNLYTSICLYLLEINKELNIKEIIKVSVSEFNTYKEYVEKRDILSSISILGMPILNSPVETRGGIISVFNQKMGYFAHRPQLLEKLCINNEIELKNKNQVILFTNKNQNCFVNVILEIIMLEIIDQLMENKINYNLVLDNFDTIMNKEEFNNIFNVSLSNNIESIVGVRNIENITNKDLFKNMIEEKIFIKNKYSIKLCGILNEISEDKCMTIICHARGSHKDSRATYNISKTLTENCINNFRFDFTSHGESEGNELEVKDTLFYEDLESVIEYFKENGYKEFILIGTSLGGRIISLINTKKFNIKKIIMWYPAIFYRNKLKLLKNKLFRKKEEKVALKKGYYLMHGRRKMSLEYLEQERKMNIFKNAINLNIPILIIHGSDDPFVNYKNSIKISKKGKNVKLIIIENENHGFKKDDKNLKYACNETIKFIKSYK